jgi:hypothetical protein
MHITQIYKQLKRHRWSPQFTAHYSTRQAFYSLLSLQQMFPGNGF